MYVASDPRSKLAKAESEEKPDAAPVSAAGYFMFDDSQPCDQNGDVRTWYAEAQNFVTTYADQPVGSRIVRDRQEDEYVVILPERETRAVVSWNGSETPVDGYSVVVVPGGPSVISFEAGGPAICFFTRKAADIVARCEALLPAHEPDRNVPPLEPWPDPVGGFKVRAYSLDVPQEEGRFGRIFRSTNFMINFVYPRQGPRDRTQLSPHKHDDFQQCSLCLAGTYVHHLRWPWETDANLWRDDDHVTIGAPSIAIIPAGALHTSEAVGAGTNQLVDVFCPPRRDFSRQTGWVLNADDYPAPANET
ncbi:MAG: hypothetical protein CMH13_02440 [Martelella sp.]|uniref:hypothetical protein n=1 Tax=unclassified Martelella TaxID=2629616 RepID=UPI000C3D02E3|nr:hypothetical protein [Martelella sp.]MAU19374.1 hypothetical protein [Martelella sp.]